MCLLNQIIIKENEDYEENWNGIDTISLIVTDGELADSAQIFFKVKPVNDPPFFIDFAEDTVEIFAMKEKDMYIGIFVLF